MRGHVLFRVGTTTCALGVEEVLEVVRTTRLHLLPASSSSAGGRPVALCDVRGRTVPVVDLREDPSIAGDVLVPSDEGRAGAIVDRVVAVVEPGSLHLEDDRPGTMPAGSCAVLRPVAGGEAARVLGSTGPVLHLVLPLLPGLAEAV